MIYFSKDYLNFFKELAANNNKDWFDANRKRYETNIKKAFENFINDLILEVQKHDKRIQITHKEAIFRINRDIRFSKNKDPYKLNRSAILSPKGRKDKAYPGLYVEMGPEHYRVYGGVYMPDKHQLYAIREQIVANASKFKKLVNNENFTSVFGEVRGEKNKIIPKEFKEAGKNTPLIYNKQFYWFAEFDPEVIEKGDILERTVKTYLANKKLMDFFANAIEKS